MADEQQESQKKAEENNELPHDVTLSERIPVEEYAKENEQVKENLKEFGESDLELFLSKVTSSAAYGKPVVRKLLGLDADLPANREHVTSPQELNLTGVLDHSSHPPKIKGGVDGATRETDASA